MKYFAKLFFLFSLALPIAGFSQSFFIDWQACYGGSEWDHPRDMIEVPDGYLIVGKTKSSDGNVSSNHGGWDIWLMKVGFAPVYARNILIALDEIEYNEPVNLPDQFKSATAEEAYNKLLNSPQPKILEVFPNPSKEFVILGYQFDADTHGTIEIRDVSGSLIQSIPFDGMQDQLTVTTRSWTPGMYMVSLVMNEKVLETTKFTLIK